METRAYPAIGMVLYEGALPNGLRLRVLPTPGYSSRSIVFAAGLGGAHRRFYRDGQLVELPAGVAHFLEHKSFDLPDGDGALQRLYANGADPNAFTSADITCYYLECTDRFEEDLRLLLHLVATPHLTEEAVEKERPIVAQEILEGEDDPDVALYYNLLRQLYEHHPIRERVAGTLESIAQIDAEMLRLCYESFYAPSNMCLCVVGDVDPELVFRIAREELPAEAGSIPVPDLGEPEGPRPLELYHQAEMDVSAPQFLIGAKIAPALRGEDMLRQRLVASLALRLLAGPTSSLYQRLYADGLIDRSFDVEVDFSAGTGTFLLGGESASPKDVLTLLRGELLRLDLEGLGPKAFERAKRASLGARLRGLEDPASLCVALAETLFEGWCPLDAFALLPQIDIAECEAFLRKELDPARLAISIIQPRRE